MTDKQKVQKATEVQVCVFGQNDVHWFKITKAEALYQIARMGDDLFVRYEDGVAYISN